jgi:hypothetical protein
MGSVHMLERYDAVGAGRKLLDFGSSNLYSATPQDIVAFVRRHNPKPRNDLDAWAAKLANGSYYDAAGGALNQAFVGELLEAAGMGYDAIDIAVGYKTTVVDLNTSALPKRMVGAYDTVVNFGTSEHILNQMNTFATVHAATKPGGIMVHSVPSVGHVDHGYYCYTSRFFFDLAGYNQYDVVDMWYDLAGGGENLFTTARQYQSYFPSLSKRLDLIGKAHYETMLDKLSIPTISISIVYRKKANVPFMGTVEMSTSVGSVPGAVTGAYSGTKG